MMKHAQAPSALAQARIDECDEPKETAPAGLSRGRDHVYPRTFHCGRRESAHHGKFMHSHLQRSTHPAKDLKLDPQSPALTCQNLAFHCLITSVFNAQLAQYHAMELLERRLSRPFSSRSQGFRHKMKYSEIENAERHWRSYSRVYIYRYGPFGSSPECFLMSGTPHVNATKIYVLSTERERGTREISDNGPLWTMECLSATRPPCEFREFPSQGLGAMMHTTASDTIRSVQSTQRILSELVAFISLTDPLDTLEILSRQHHNLLPSSLVCDSPLSYQTAKRNSSGHYDCYPHSADPPIHNYSTTLQRKQNKQTTTSQQNKTDPDTTASRQQQVVSFRATAIRFAAYVHLVQQTARIIIELRNTTIAANLAVLHTIQLTSRAKEITSIHSKKTTAEMDSGTYPGLDDTFEDFIQDYEAPELDPDFSFPLNPEMFLEAFPTLPTLPEEPQVFEDLRIFDWIDFNACDPSAAFAPEYFNPYSPTSPPTTLYNSSAPTENGTPAAAGSPSSSTEAFTPVSSSSPQTITSSPSAPPPPASPPASPPPPTSATPLRLLYPCPHPGCPRNDFPRPCDQRKHTKVHQKNFVCEHPGCGGRFSSRKDLNRHLEAVHDKLKPYTCSKCGSAHSRRDNLKVHEKQVHERRNDKRMRRRSGTTSLPK